MEIDNQRIDRIWRIQDIHLEKLSINCALPDIFDLVHKPGHVNIEKTRVKLNDFDILRTRKTRHIDQDVGSHHGNIVTENQEPEPPSTGK